MHSIDWLIITIYCLLTLGMGVYFMRRAGKNIESYFVAGRKLPWWILGFSATATYSGAGAAPA
ncbi:MAG: hypothetical protein KAX11_05615, partial [Candidatus Aminicenantes bacterium]|nr:hypothetical protein [Candidatus Aminicenantes bacterium]